MQDYRLYLIDSLPSVWSRILIGQQGLGKKSGWIVSAYNWMPGAIAAAERVNRKRVVKYSIISLYEMHASMTLDALIKFKLMKKLLRYAPPAQRSDITHKQMAGKYLAYLKQTSKWPSYIMNYLNDKSIRRDAAHPTTVPELTLMQKLSLIRTFATVTVTGIVLGVVAIIIEAAKFLTSPIWYPFVATNPSFYGYAVEGLGVPFFRVFRKTLFAPIELSLGIALGLVSTYEALRAPTKYNATADEITEYSNPVTNNQFAIAKTVGQDSTRNIVALMAHAPSIIFGSWRSTSHVTREASTETIPSTPTPTNSPRHKKAVALA